MAREAKTWLLIKKISPALPVLVCPRHPRPQACLNCLQMSLDGEWKGGREAWAQVAAAVVLNDGYWPPHWWPWWHKAEWLRPNSRSSATRLLRFPCAAPLQQRTRSDIRCHASPLKWLLLDIILRFCVFGIVTLSMCCAMVEAPAIRYSIKCHSCMNAEFSKVVISLLQNHLFRSLPFLLYIYHLLEYMTLFWNVCFWSPWLFVPSRRSSWARCILLSSLLSNEKVWAGLGLVMWKFGIFLLFLFSRHPDPEPNVNMHLAITSL